MSRADQHAKQRGLPRPGLAGDDPKRRAFAVKPAGQGTDLLVAAAEVTLPKPEAHGLSARAPRHEVTRVECFIQHRRHAVIHPGQHARAGLLIARIAEKRQMVWLFAQRDPADFHALGIIPRAEDRDLTPDLLSNLTQRDVLDRRINSQHAVAVAVEHRHRGSAQPVVEGQVLASGGGDHPGPALPGGHLLVPGQDRGGPRVTQIEYEQGQGTWLARVRLDEIDPIGDRIVESLAVAADHVQPTFAAGGELAMRHDVDHQHGSAPRRQYPANLVGGIPVPVRAVALHVAEAAERSGDFRGAYGGFFQRSQLAQSWRAVILLGPKRNTDS